MNDEGFITLNRKLMNWEWWTDHNTTRVWIYILLNANWKDGRFKGMEIPRGSFVTSYAKIAKNTGLSVMQARTAINHLILTSEITIKTTSKFSVITVKNYDLYQSANKLDNKQTTSKQQANNNNRTKKQGNNGINNARVYDFEALEKSLFQKGGEG